MLFFIGVLLRGPSGRAGTLRDSTYSDLVKIKADNWERIGRATLPVLIQPTLERSELLRGTPKVMTSCSHQASNPAWVALEIPKTAIHHHIL